MKLKYLLPVATIASAATIVTPLVTSCNNGLEFEYDINVTDITPQLKTKPLEAYEGELLKVYLTDAKKDHRIFGDDFANTLHNQLYKTDKFESFVGKIGIENVNIDKATINVKAYYKFVDKETKEVEENEYTFKNMPIELQKIGTYLLMPTFLGVYKDGEGDKDAAIKLIKDNNSSIVGFTKETAPHGHVDTNKYDMNANNVDKDHLSTWNRLYNNARIVSYYLSKIS